jgi:hypothetical protein
VSALKPSDVLSKAADLIEPPGAWTQGTWARDDTGATDPVEGAVCWCAYGAIYQVCGTWHSSECNAAMRILARALRIPQTDAMGSIGLWNDQSARTQAEVVKALRAAAELANGEGQ